jgi:hypothetical protein
MTLTNILLTIIAIAISVIAIKVTFTFDINKYLESRKVDVRNKIKNYCTHMYVKDINWEVGIQSAFVSPSWTLNHICQKCWLVLHHLDYSDEQQRMEELIQNPKEFRKQSKKFEKLLKKGGYL